jgi:type VI secretion system protein ImpC
MSGRSGIASSRARAAAWDDGPFRILVIGDFSGGDQAVAGQGIAEPQAVAGDSLDALMARLAPAVALPLEPGDTGSTVAFGCLDDLHPDALVARLQPFRKLMNLRRQLSDPASFAAAVAEMKQGAPALAAEPPSRPPTPRTASAPPAVRDAVDRLARAAVGSAAVTAESAEQALYVGIVDDALGRMLRVILQEPAFHRMEVRWRSLAWLLAAIETGEDLEVFVIDAGRETLLAELRGHRDDITASRLYRRIEEGPQGWSVIIADLTLGADADDIALAAVFAAIGTACGAAVLAGAAAGLLGCSSLVTAPDPVDWSPLEAEAESRWRTLRRFDLAASLGLLLPRVLLRLPYGAATDPIESFAFAEADGGFGHEDYLWGNPAYAAAILLSRSFRRSGWSMTPGDDSVLDGLPAHVAVAADGEKRLQPCAEVALSDRAAAAVLERGPMPLISDRSRPSFRIPRFQSIAHPPRPLAGRWG